MPRRQRELVTAVPLPTKSLVASATRYDGRTARIYNNDAGTWQAECYRHYRICGEARFAANFFGNAMSKAVLYIGDADADKRASRIESGPAVDALDELFNGCEGQAAMLSAIGIHLTIAGECYLIGRPSPEEADGDIWEIRSVLEVKSNGVTGRGGRWWITQGGGQPNIELDAEAVIIRIWTPDPSQAIQADSPFKSLLPILEEIEWLTKYVFAQCSQRLAGAGVWILPEEIDFPEAPDAPEGSPERNKADGLLAYLADIMLKPITDPGNPAAKIPGIITAPGALINNAHWQTFWSELDTEAKGLRQEAIQRFALGMDLPPERILGIGSNLGTGGGKSHGVSHWGAWQIDEDTIKMHIEPKLEVVTSALSFYYVRPVSEVPNATVYYDTSALRLRPDRSAESLELYDRGLVSAAVVLTENGFDLKEAMSPEERKLWLTIKVAGGSATPDMVNEALRALGVDLGPVGMPAPFPEVPNEARPAPSLEGHPNRDLPEQAAVVAAADALCYRALERAGNRIRQVVRDGGGTPPSCSSFEVHTYTPAPPNSTKKLLDDAWACAANVLAPMGVEVAPLVDQLNGYVSSLLITGNSHSRASLEKWLATS